RFKSYIAHNPNKSQLLRWLFVLYALEKTKGLSYCERHSYHHLSRGSDGEGEGLNRIGTRSIAGSHLSAVFPCCFRRSTQHTIGAQGHPRWQPSRAQS